VKSSELIKMIKADGWYLVRTKGSHHHFKHPTRLGLVTVPHPQKDVPMGTANSVLRQAGIEKQQK